MRAANEVSTMPSGEMVAPMIDAFLRDRPQAFPLNLPNAGQAPDLPPDVVVEAMCVADGDGLRPRDEVRLPPVLAEWVRRISAAQEATVAAALSGDREQGGRGDAARSARGPDRLRPPRADDRRDARRHRAVAAAVRVSTRLEFDALTVHIGDDVDEMARDAAVDAAAALRAADRGAR